VTRMQHQYYEIGAAISGVTRDAPDDREAEAVSGIPYVMNAYRDAAEAILDS